MTPRPRSLFLVKHKNKIEPVLWEVVQTHVEKCVTVNGSAEAELNSAAEICVRLSLVALGRTLDALACGESKEPEGWRAPAFLFPSPPPAEKNCEEGVVVK